MLHNSLISGQPMSNPILLNTISNTLKLNKYHNQILFYPQFNSIFFTLTRNIISTFVI